MNLLSIDVKETRVYNPKKKNCVCLVKKAKKDYFDNLDLKSVTDNKKFWKLGRHFLLIKKLIVIK